MSDLDKKRDELAEAMSLEIIPKGDSYYEGVFQYREMYPQDLRDVCVRHFTSGFDAAVKLTGEMLVKDHPAVKEMEEKYEAEYASRQADLLRNHPYVSELEKETARLKAENKDFREAINNAFEARGIITDKEIYLGSAPIVNPLRELLAKHTPEGE